MIAGKVMGMDKVKSDIGFGVIHFHQGGRKIYIRFKMDTKANNVNIPKKKEATIISSYWLVEFE